MHILVTLYTCRVTHSGEAWGGTLPDPTIFFEIPPPSEPPMGHPLLKNEAPLSEKHPPPPIETLSTLPRNDS